MGKSSKDKRDAYYRLAKEQGWRARSAFKLLQLDEEFNLFEGVSRVVDLCAAPGSWSQVLSRVLIKGEKFGRAAWLDKHAEMRKLLLGHMNEESNTDPAEPAATSTKSRHEDFAESTDNSNKQDAPERLNVEAMRSLNISDDSEDAPTKNVKIVAVDLQPMSSLEGITTLRADITDPSTIPRLLRALDPEAYADADPAEDTTDTVTNDGVKEATSDPSSPETSPSTRPVDLILCDGAPDVTGLHDLDIYIQSQLLRAALGVCLAVLRPGPRSTFVAKIFRGKDVDLLYTQLRLVFASVTVAKPRSSRASSLEAFVVCRGFAPPPGVAWDFTVVAPPPPPGAEARPARTAPSRRVRDDGVVELELGSEEEEDEAQPGDDDEEARARAYANARWIAPFLACGDLSAPDADATYTLPAGHVSLDPVQPPTAPPYKKALEMRRADGGAYGKTKK